LRFGVPTTPPRQAQRLGLPRGEPAHLPTICRPARRPDSGVPADVAARVVPIRSAARALAALPTGLAGLAAARRLRARVGVAAKLALEYVAAGHLVPMVRAEGPGEGVAYWRMATVDDGRLVRLAAALPPAAYRTAARNEDDQTLWAGTDLLAAFWRRRGRLLCAYDDRSAPGAVAVTSSQDKQGGLATGLVGRPHRRRAGHRAARRHRCGRCGTWASALVPNGGSADAQLCLSCTRPVWRRPARIRKRRGPLAYHLTAADDPSLMVPPDQVWATGTASMKLLVTEAGRPAGVPWRGLAEAARLFPPIDASLSEQAADRQAPDARQASDFLSTARRRSSAAGLVWCCPRS